MDATSLSQDKYYPNNPAQKSGEPTHNSRVIATSDNQLSQNESKDSTA